MSNENTNEQTLEMKEMETFARLLRCKDQEGFKLVLDLVDEMAEELLYQARDMALTPELKIEVLNKSAALAYVRVYVDECIGRAEEAVEKAEEGRKG